MRKYVLYFIILSFYSLNIEAANINWINTLCVVKESSKKTANIGYKDMKVYYQAHRGGLREVPENTLPTFIYAWKLGGLPEADIRTTKDGVIICLHDKTLARTTDAPASIEDINVLELTFEEIRKCDAGAYFGEEYAGQKVPALTEVFEQLKTNPEYQMYLDLKDVDLKKLGNLIKDYNVGKQIIFAHNKQENLITFQNIAPEVRTMLWIGGEPDEIKAKYEAARQSGYKGLNQVQLHLHNIETRDKIKYYIEDDYLKKVLAQMNKAGLDLEVLPFEFDEESLSNLLNIGICWYATDYPKRFLSVVDKWRSSGK